jgi:hypothetical protein
MKPDSSVMDVSIATVAKDVGTTVTGIQGGRDHRVHARHGGADEHRAEVGALIGRKGAFAIGCVIYGCGSFHDRERAEPAGAPARLVVPGVRQRRLGADHVELRTLLHWSVRDQVSLFLSVASASPHSRPARGCCRSR